jgi:hypothetical protein
LPGTRRCLVERKNMVQDPDENLQPFVFAAAQFVHFEPEMAFLRFVGLFQKLAE